MPRRVAEAMTSRQGTWAAVISRAKVSSASRLTSLGSAAWAARTRSRKAARMMHPARQIPATAPRSMVQPYSVAASRIIVQPWS